MKENIKIKEKNNLDKIAKEHLSCKICGKCSMYEECAKGQVACVDIEIFKAGYKTCEAEFVKLFGQFWEVQK